VVNKNGSRFAELISQNFLSRILLCMRLVLGFDGGGTKTSCVLMDQNQVILAQSRSGPSNPLRVGIGQSLAAIQDAARQAATSASIDISQIKALCAGLAGVGEADVCEKMRRLLAESFPQAVAHVTTDLQIVLSAASFATESGDGPIAVLLAGTGSAAIGRGKDGQILRVGGRGPLNGDEGSAYDVGRRALLAADNIPTEGHSGLGEKILTELGVASWADARELSRSKPEEVYARLFPVVAAAADSGDETAQDILKAAAEALAALTTTLIGRLSLKGQEFLLVKSGGMMNRSHFFDAEIDQRLRLAAPKASITLLSMPPAEAAARTALQLLQTSEAEEN
jgi:N-acetylglucosamine kinase-like BadF-type ATPase